MSIVVKYRVHEVAKDFGVSSKEVGEILEKYSKAPKNHMQVLQEDELDFIFDYLTQHHQLESLAEVFQEKPEKTVKPEAKPEAKPESKPEAKKENKPAAASTQTDTKQTQKKQAARSDGQRKTDTAVKTRQTQGRTDALKRFEQRASQAQQRTDKKSSEVRKQEKPRQTRSQIFQPKGSGITSEEPQVIQESSRKVGNQRVVDTRFSNVNIEKYDEKFDRMAGTSGRDRDLRRGGKEKFGNRQKKRQGQIPSAKRRQEEKEKMQRLQLEIAKKQPVKVLIPDEITVGELASRMKKTSAEVIKKLIKEGVFASVSDTIDYDTAALVALDMGCKVEKEVIVTVEEKLIDDSIDDEKDLVPRAPVVVVMGHVDHGKTSLLDYIRHTRVAAGEAGGITQAIGAYTVDVNGKPITFLDTPGHEAFTAMRARGAMITDIAILVVAADDGIMPQTVESINHAKAAKIPIVVAINKMDVKGANPDRIKQQLTEYDLVSEEWGGDTIICPISAKTGEGIDELLENLVLVAEMQELKANPNRAGKGAVIEARLDKGRGPITTVLVQNGTLRKGDLIIAGTAVGRVRTMVNDKGENITEAGPSMPAEISGLSEVPSAGDTFNVVADEHMAKELVEQRKTEAKDALSGSSKKITLENLFSQIQAGEMKTLNIIVKADVQGSVEAVRTSLEKLSNEEAKVSIIHAGVGAINESDVMLASTSNAIIVGFNVRPDNVAKEEASRQKVDIRLYRVIYDCINEIKAALNGMLSPTLQEAILGHAEVRELWKVSKVGTIEGCYVTDGKIQRGSKARVLRDNIVIYEGELASLRRFKDDVKEVQSGYECGMQIDKFNDVHIGDIIESFVIQEVRNS
jgi:translation initiation factor IF-2